MEINLATSPTQLSLKKLRDEGYLVADEFGTSLAKVEVVLKKYDLFQIDE